MRFRWAPNAPRPIFRGRIWERGDFFAHYYGALVGRLQSMLRFVNGWIVVRYRFAVVYWFPKKCTAKNYKSSRGLNTSSTFFSLLIRGLTGCLLFLRDLLYIILVTIWRRTDDSARSFGPVSRLVAFAMCDARFASISLLAVYFLSFSFEIYSCCVLRFMLYSLQFIAYAVRFTVRHEESWGVM